MRNARPVLRILVWAVLLAFTSGLIACSGGDVQVTPYRPPTLIPQATSLFLLSTTPTASSDLAEALHPAVTPACSDGLVFLEDLTIPDGSQVAPGDILDKRWLVKNSGTCNWDEDYRLKLVSGLDLGAPVEQALYPARGGTESVVRILFTAPADPGYYQSAWQACDPQGDPFGDPFFIEILVEAP